MSYGGNSVTCCAGRVETGPGRVGIRNSAPGRSPAVTLRPETG